MLSTRQYNLILLLRKLQSNGEMSKNFGDQQPSTIVNEGATLKSEYSRFIPLKTWPKLIINLYKFELMQTTDNINPKEIGSWPLFKYWGA